MSRRKKSLADLSQSMQYDLSMQVSMPIKVCMLRLLLTAKPDHKFHDANDMVVKLLEPLGLELDPDAAATEYHPPLSVHFGAMHALLLSIEARGCDKFEVPPVLAANVRLLQRALDLSSTEVGVLSLAVLVHTEYGLGFCSTAIGDLTRARCCSLVASVLKISREQVEDALASRGTLASSGLVVSDLSESGEGDLVEWLDLGNAKLARRMLEPQSSVVDLLSDTLHRAPRSRLAADAFSHVQQDVNAAVGLPCSALRCRTPSLATGAKPSARRHPWQESGS